MLNLKEGFIPPDDKFFKNVKSDVDYFKGNWKQCTLMVQNYIHYEICKTNISYWVNTFETLRSMQVTGFSLEKFDENCEIYSHTDTDLLGDYPIMRMFYPLNDEEFYFKAYVPTQQGLLEMEIIDNKPIMFCPHKNHSFKNLKNQYYFIIDIAYNINNLDSNFWKHYFNFACEHYLPLNYIYDKLK